LPPDLPSRTGDPAHLETVDVNGDLYMGRVVDAGPLGRRGRRPEAQHQEHRRGHVSEPASETARLRIFALDRPEVAPGFAAAS